MADETRIIRVEVDNSDTISRLEQNKLAIINLKEEQKKLNQERKNMTDKEYASELVRTEQLIKSHQNEYSKLSHELQGTKSFTDQLKGSLTQNSAELDKVTGGAYSSAEGFIGMTKQAMAFVATPMGAVIAAIGLALGVLTNYFKSTGDGADEMAEAMGGLNAVIKLFSDTVNSVVRGLKEMDGPWVQFIKNIAEAVIKLNPLTLMLKQIEILFPSLTQKIKDQAAAGQELAKVLDDIQDREREFAVTSAQNRNEIDALILQSKNRATTERERIALLQKASDIEKKDNAQAIKLAQDRLQYELQKADVENRSLDLGRRNNESLEEWGKRVRLNTQIADEYRDAVSNAFSKIAAVQNESIKIQEKINNQQDALALKAAKNEAEAPAKATELLKLKIQEIDLRNQNRLAAIAEGDEINKNADNSIAAIQRHLQEKIKATDKENQLEGQKTKIAELEAQNRLATISSTLGQAAALFKDDTIAYKLLGIARATVDTYRAANLALASLPPPLGAIAAGVSIATGLANVAKITKIGGFEEGGYTGPGANNEVAGVVHRNEYVVPAGITMNPAFSGVISMLDSARRGYMSGGMVTSNTGQIEQSAALAGAFKTAPVVYSSWREAVLMNKSVTYKESISQR